MIYTKLVVKAINTMYLAHSAKLDKGGIPYVFHPYHLAEQMNSEEEVCVALLHDVIEDGHPEIANTIKYGFSQKIMDAIIAITRNPDEEYFAYIDRVIQNPLASKVKEADLIHNMNLDRILSYKKPDEKELKKILKRNEKYREALRRIRAARKDEYGKHNEER